MTRLIRRLIASVIVASALAACSAPPGVTITWSTGSEFGITGFVIERGAYEDGAFEVVAPFIVASDDPVIGHEYRFVDKQVDAGRTYWYRLLVVSPENQLSLLGALQATAP
jgi:hypothetical protein